MSRTRVAGASADTTRPETRRYGASATTLTPAHASATASAARDRRSASPSAQTTAAAAYCTRKCVASSTTGVRPSATAASVSRASVAVAPASAPNRPSRQRSRAATRSRTVSVARAVTERILRPRGESFKPRGLAGSVPGRERDAAVPGAVRVLEDERVPLAARTGVPLDRVGAVVRALRRPCRDPALDDGREGARVALHQFGLGDLGAEVVLVPPLEGEAHHRGDARLVVRGDRGLEGGPHRRHVVGGRRGGGAREAEAGDQQDGEGRAGDVSDHRDLLVRAGGRASPREARPPRQRTTRVTGRPSRRRAA